MTFTPAAPRFSQTEKYMYFWQLQKKDKVKADVRSALWLHLIKDRTLPSEKANHTFL